MRGLLKVLKNKTYDEGMEVLRNTNIELNEGIANKENGVYELYPHFIDDTNWIGYTTTYKDVEDDEPDVDLENGYWTICKNGQSITELEI